MKDYEGKRILLPLALFLFVFGAILITLKNLPLAFVRTIPSENSLQGLWITTPFAADLRLATLTIALSLLIGLTAIRYYLIGGEDDGN